MQLKIDHDYFKSYLVKLSDYLTDKYLVCDTREDSEYLILYCKITQIIRKELKQEFDIKKFSLKNLFNTKIGQEFLFKFIEKTQIGTKNWLLQTADYESGDEE